MPIPLPIRCPLSASLSLSAVRRCLLVTCSSEAAKKTLVPSKCFTQGGFPCVSPCFEVISGAKFGHLKGYLRGQVKVISGAKLMRVYFYSGFRRLLHTQLSFCVFVFWPVVRQLSKNNLFQKKGAKIGFFNFLCFELDFWIFLLC